MSSLTFFPSRGGAYAFPQPSPLKTGGLYDRFHRENLAEETLCQCPGPDPKRLAASTSFLLEHSLAGAVG